MPNDSAESGQKTYVVSFDVANRLQLFRFQNLTVPPADRPMFRLFQRQFLQRVRSALPDVLIQQIEMGELMRRLQSYSGSFVGRESGQVAVSTCSPIAFAVKGEMLSINRLFDAHGDLLGYGPRPCFPTIADQLVGISARMAGRSAVIVEDGAFTGQTLSFLVENLESAGIRVSKVIIGFCCSRAEAQLKGRFQGEIVVLNKLVGLVDWLPDHDLIPFVPHCGRVVGEMTPDGPMPACDQRGIGRAFPYILPFGKPEEWATLPPRAARDISAFCLEAAIELFQCIEGKSDRKIWVRDLFGTNIGTLLPAMVDTGSVPDLDERVTDFLGRMRDMVG